MYSILFIIFFIIPRCQPTHGELAFLEHSAGLTDIRWLVGGHGSASRTKSNLNANFLGALSNIVRLPVSERRTSSPATIQKTDSSIRTINLNSTKLKSIEAVRSKFKSQLHKHTRRRRRSAHYSSNLSLDDKIDKQTDDDDQCLDCNISPALPYLIQATERRIDKAELKMSVNVSQTTNALPYDNTNSTSFVELPPSLKVFFYCVYTLIFFVGLIGNSLNIYVVYSNKSMYNVTYFFITNLAMSDILLCLFSVPITPMYLLLYNQGVSVYVSAFTLMSIAVDRYFVIIFPFKKRMSVKMCVVIIIIIWISGSTLTMPYAIFMATVEVVDEDGSRVTFCEEAWPNDASRRTFSTCTSVIQFIVPFVIIAFCYSKVCSKLKTRAKFKPGAKSARKEELERERSRRTNRMLIAMVIIFGLAWLPLNVHNLVVDFYDSANNWPYIRCFFLLAHAIAMSCTCYNFCLYAYLNDHFRKNFKDVLPCFDVPFFQRMRGGDAQQQATNQTTNTPNAANMKKTPSGALLNVNSTNQLLCSSKDMLSKIEPSTKQITITDYEEQNELTNKPLVKQSSMCSEPVATCVEDSTANVKCPCSTSYPNLQPQLLANSLTNTGGEQSIVDKEPTSTGSGGGSGKHLIKCLAGGLRNKLRFSVESSFDEQAIALSEYTSREPNNNNPIKPTDQLSPIVSPATTPPASKASNASISSGNVPNNEKCNTIFLSGLNDKNLTLQMDNV